MPPRDVSIWLMLLTFWLVVQICRAFRSGQITAGTSLGSAWNWAMAAQFAWLISSTTNLLIPEKAAILDQVWFWTAILTVCPLISVLGARRPTDRVWNLFILLPLLLVLGWPALTVLFHWSSLPPIRIQAPVFLGFGLVLIMGVGNYLGTRFSLPVLFIGVAVGLLLIPVSTLAETHAAAVLPCRLAALACFCLGLELAWRIGQIPVPEGDAFDRLWDSFRSTFGIVWAQRIQERINASASQEQWACRLGPRGFEWISEASPLTRADTIQKMDHTLRWLLRRFVDPDWIDHFLVSPDDGSRPT